MANLYTYQDFEDRVKKLGLSGQISDADYQLAKNNADAGIALLEAKNKWNTAADDAGRTAANTEAERIRSAYGGYTGGKAGADYNINTPTTPSSFAEDDPYTDLINTTIKNFNDKKFEYDAEKDPLYSSYKKTYTREGRRASEDTMAQAAAMTGGIPSSYAVTAGQQAGNYYASQMADKIPELEGRAYDRYQNEKNELLQQIALQQQERDNAYNKHLDQIDYEQGERDFLLSQEQQRLENERYDNEWEASQKAQALTDAYNAANVGDWTKLKALGVNPDPLVVQAYGEEKAREDLLQQMEIANYYAELGDFSKWEELGAKPDVSYINSKSSDTAKTDAELQAELSRNYGEYMTIPSNMVQSYEAIYPGFRDYMKGLGYSIGLTDGEIEWFNENYPTGEVPEPTWNEYVANGYSEADLMNNGFFPSSDTSSQKENPLPLFKPFKTSSSDT